MCDVTVDSLTVSRVLTTAMMRARDRWQVAARNVLLDITMSCKVADFGMSVLLPPRGAKTADGEYMKNYVRLRGHRPVRWSAPEVLAENRSQQARLATA